MTSHPKDLSDDLIEVMANSKKICPHLHLPLQSGSSRILKAMNRRYDKEKYLALAKKIRERMPDIALTTDTVSYTHLCCCHRKKPCSRKTGSYDADGQKCNGNRMPYQDC